MSFMDFFSRFTGGFGGASSVDLAIALGTANTLVAITGEGVVLNEPSVVAIERSTHRVLAVGHEAKQMINHTPDAFSAEHPLRDGVIADYDVTEAMLSAFINKAIERRYPWQAKPRIVICIPCGATSVEKRAVFEAAIQSGARQAYLIEEPMAAAMGAGELLAAAGMAALPGECPVWSAPQQNAVAVMAAAENALAAVHERLGGRARYTTPLLCVPQTSVPTVWMYYAAGLLYIKVYDGKLRFAEVVPAPDEADLLYMLERLGSEFRLRDYTLRIGSGDGRALKRKLGGYFRQIVCE